jgi:hypothetical protein
MFFHDTDKHHVPHIHAEYQGQVAVYSIHDGSIIAGGLPSKGLDHHAGQLIVTPA